jgi:uncharacterized protein YoxC
MDVFKIIFLGILAVAFAVLVGYLVPALLELRRTIRKIRSMADEEINPLIAQVRELVEETRPKIDSITQKIEAMADEEIKPLTSNVKEITGTVNEEVAKVSGIVDTVSDMVSRTQEVVSLYQDKAVIPAIEMISLWDGIKKGASVLFRREK